MQGECNPRGALVLAAGYAVHDRPFYASNREGLTSYLIRLQTEGYATALVGHHLVKLSPGDLVMYAPGDPYVLSIGHTLDAESGQPAVDTSSAVSSSTPDSSVSGDYFVFCRGRWIDNWWSKTERSRHQTITLTEQTLELWRQLAWHHRGVARHKVEIQDYLLRALCLHLDDITAAAHSTPTTADALAAHQMKAFLEQHAGDDIAIQDVAHHVGLSVSRAVHLFKETFNQTMVQFLQETRLSVACDRIRFSRMTLEEAAESAGFRSYSYFYRLFRSHFGMSPKQFRANMK